MNDKVMKIDFNHKIYHEFGICNIYIRDKCALNLATFYVRTFFYTISL